MVEWQVLNVLGFIIFEVCALMMQETVSLSSGRVNNHVIYIYS